MKCVVSRTQVGVAGVAVAAVHLGPFFLQTVQAETVTGAVRIHITQTDKLERDTVLPVGQIDCVRIPDRPGKERTRANRDCLSVYLKLSHYRSGRARTTRQNFTGIERVKAVHSPEIHTALTVLVTGLPVELFALQTVTLVVVVETVFSWIEHRQAVTGAHPKVTGPIGKNALDDVVRQSLASGVNAVSFSSGIQAHQARFGTQPQNSV